MKLAKLTKLKSALKKWPSFNKLDRTLGSSVAAVNEDSAPGEANQVAGKLHPVYVGKSRRRYLLGSEVVDHPLFQVLVNKSDSSDRGGPLSVACEVVLFDHLLWMLENAAAEDDSHSVPVDELVEFYSY